MKLIYPGIGGKPIIAACVRCGLSGQYYLIKMLVDTGADESCFPASFAFSLGHDNGHGEVERIKDAVIGIGGSSDAFLHSVQICLLNPQALTKTVSWESPITKVQFVEKLECVHGIIGMDVIKHWKSFSIIPQKKGGVMLIIEI